jgi:hypothetical protein
VIVGVPWKPGCPHREASWSYVHAHLRRHVERVIVCNPDPFTRAAARNQAIAAVNPTDVVILHDADMIAPPIAYQEMHDLAAETGRLVIGYHQYRPLDQHLTALALDGADPWRLHPRETTDGWSQGGIIAIRADAWTEVGGMDERFQGWGCEDWAFAHACSVLLGPNLRLSSPAVHLWHPHGAGADPAQDEANGALLTRYTAATTVEQIRRVQQAPAGGQVASLVGPPPDVSGGTPAGALTPHHHTPEVLA